MNDKKEEDYCYMAKDCTMEILFKTTFKDSDKETAKLKIPLAMTLSDYKTILVK